MRIPEIRDELNQLAGELQCPRLAVLAAHLRRRPRATNGVRAARSMTPQIRAEIIAYHEANPRATQMQIAKYFNVNTGRVSETLAGYRT